MADKVDIINRGFTIIKSKIRVMEYAAIRANDLDVSDVQWNYLVWVIENKGMKMTDLAEKLGVRKGTLSNNIKYLVSKKLIEKKANGRGVSIEPTAKGSKYIALHRDTHERISGELLKVLTEAELNSLVNVGEKLRDRL